MDSQISVHPLFIGLTRPPMYLGVTLQFFLLNGFMSLVFFVATMKSVFAITLFGLLHSLGYLCCWVDYHLFDILRRKLAFQNNKNKTFWQCQSYDPY